MKIPMLKVTRLLAACAILSFGLPSLSQACEKPVFKKSLFVEKLGGAEFRIDWSASKNADQYAVKYILRIPEGRTIKQREFMSGQAFYVFPAEELPKGERLQLIVEVASQCSNASSAVTVAQIALNNPDSQCRFGAQKPQLRNADLSWHAVAGADNYLLCFFKLNGSTNCRETIDPSLRVALEETVLIGISPQCHGITGEAFFLSTKNDFSESHSLP